MLSVMVTTELFSLNLAVQRLPPGCPNPEPNDFGIKLVRLLEEGIRAFDTKAATNGADANRACQEHIVRELQERGFRLAMGFDLGHLYEVDLSTPRRPAFRYQFASEQRDLDSVEPIELADIETARRWFSDWSASDQSQTGSRNPAGIGKSKVPSRFFGRAAYRIDNLAASGKLHRLHPRASTSGSVARDRVPD